LKDKIIQKLNCLENGLNFYGMSVKLFTCEVDGDAKAIDLQRVCFESGLDVKSRIV
jgi:hypothetical protein